LAFKHTKNFLAFHSFTFPHSNSSYAHGMTHITRTTDVVTKNTNSRSLFTVKEINLFARSSTVFSHFHRSNSQELWTWRNNMNEFSPPAQNQRTHS
jgi:hypothetical protein